MTLEQFQTAINGKLFIELNSSDAVSNFVNLSDFRAAADTAGVIVFLTTIKKIYAKGFYYGGDFDGILGRVTSLEQSIASLGTPLANLVNRVATNESDIATNASNITSALSRISTLETEVSTLTGGTSLSEAVNTLVDARLDDVLDTEVGALGYIKESDITTLRSAVTQLTSDLALKAAQSDFSALVTKLGTDNWNTSTDGGTVVTVINTLKSTTQTLSTDLSNLQSAVSLIPHFEVQVVEKNANTGYPNVAEPDKATIYLVPSPEDEQEGNSDMFTEYIWINSNAGKYDNQEPPQPLPAHYQWEKLGRQAFKMSQYMDAETINGILDDLEASINSKIAGLNAEKIAQITTNQTNITALQTAVGNINTSLSYLLDSNGNFILTGEDIKTTASGNTTIATDIASLQTGKLDANAVNWVVISSALEQPQSPEPEPEP